MSTQMKRFTSTRLPRKTKHMTRKASSTCLPGRGCMSMPTELTTDSITSIQPSPVVRCCSAARETPMWSKFTGAFTQSPPASRQSLRVTISGISSPVGSSEQRQSLPLTRFTKRIPKPISKTIPMMATFSSVGTEARKPSTMVLMPRYLSTRRKGRSTRSARTPRMSRRAASLSDDTKLSTMSSSPERTQAKSSQFQPERK
mmetsp:Transcript_92087/g.260652  ORF Transcript_92087/g.260652 Transcript_92087/m.260652 type:complete len:201 (-) Transcript_92087:411-1013(-)